MEKKNRIEYMKRYLLFLFLFFHNYIYIYSNGRIGKFLNKRPCLILYTTGAKTNLERKNVLVFLKEDNEICIVASKGGSDTNPGWYHNLKKYPECEVQIGRDKFRAVSREISEGKMLSDKQTIQNWIAESRAEINAARLMVQDAAKKIDAQGTYKTRAEISLSLIHISEPTRPY